MSSSKRAAVQITSSEPSAVALDPFTLGRPFHLLDVFCERFREKLSGYLAARFNQQYGAALSVKAVSITSSPSTQNGAPWLGYRSLIGDIAFKPDRRLLLTLLDYRYGEPHASVLTAPIDVSSPATETEHRLAVTLGLDLLGLLTACIDSIGIAADTAPTLFEPALLRMPAAGDQLVCTTVEDRSHKISGTIEFALSEAWLARLFSRIAPQGVTMTQAAALETSLAMQIGITIHARLLSREITLGEFLDLVPGDIIPVRFNTAADVFVHGSRLYTASVVQHEGKLWLTSFEDAEPNMASIDDSDLDFDTVLDGANPETADISGAEPEPAQPRPSRRKPLQILRRIPVRLTLEVGSATLTLADLMALEAGSTVELDSLAGEPLTIKVNGATVGRAEVVVSGQHYGLRVVNLVDLKTLAS